LAVADVTRPDGVRDAIEFVAALPVPWSAHDQEIRRDCIGMPMGLNIMLARPNVEGTLEFRDLPKNVNDSVGGEVAGWASLEARMPAGSVCCGDG
jgi:hypothetical protein